MSPQAACEIYKIFLRNYHQEKMAEFEGQVIAAKELRSAFLSKGTLSTSEVLKNWLYKAPTYRHDPELYRRTVREIFFLPKDSFMKRKLRKRMKAVLREKASF